MRRIKVITCADLGKMKGMRLVPVDADTGEPLAGVTRCEIEQPGYNELPRLVLEFQEFDVEATCGVRRGDRS